MSDPGRQRAPAWRIAREKRVPNVTRMSRLFPHAAAILGIALLAFPAAGESLRAPDGAGAGVAARKFEMFLFTGEPRDGDAATGITAASGSWGRIRINAGASPREDRGKAGLGGASGDGWDLLYLTPRLPSVTLNDPRIGLTVPSAASGIAEPSGFALGLAYEYAPSSIRIRAGLAGIAPGTEPAKGGGFGTASPVSERSWQMGTVLGYANFELGAAFGDAPGAGCTANGECRGGDFWDVSLAYSFTSGAVAARYSTRAGPSNGAESRTVEVLSLNAGYRVAPGLNILGAVNWVDIGRSDIGADRTGEAAVFMLRTRVRF